MSQEQTTTYKDSANGLSHPADHLMQLATGYWASAALGAAVTLGIFDQLSDKPKKIEELAPAIGANVRYLQGLLQPLVGIDILGRKAEGYAITPAYRPYLTSESPCSLLPALRFNMDLFGLWQQLPRAVQTGQPIMPDSGHLGADPAQMKRFVLGMDSRARALVPSWIESIDLSGVEQLLDVGAGPGTVSRMLMERFSELRVIQQDLPPVLDVARELAEAEDCLSRLTFLPGSYHDVYFPTGMDAVLYCGALHQESEATAHGLFQRLFTSLKSGGRLYVVDFMTDIDNAHPPFSSLFGLNMMLLKPGAGVHRAEDVKVWLQQAGFAETILIKPHQSVYWIIEAVKA